MRITPEMLLSIFMQANGERHESEQAWIDEEMGIDSVVLDGRFDFERIAYLLSDTHGESK